MSPPRRLLEIRRLVKRFPLRRGLFGARRGSLTAVAGVDLEVAAGECVALVGESGSGKSTLGRAALRLIEPSSGEVRFEGEDLLALSRRQLRRRRRRFQMIFQDPHASLDPRLAVGAAVAEPLTVHGLLPRRQRPQRVAALLAEVGLSADLAGRYPHQLSGGERQRVGIARALAAEPDLVVADEPVAALDVSIQAQIINLLARLQDDRGLGLLFIAHDLALVEQIAHRVAVMYLGRIVEQAPCRRLFAAPRHPYTAGLLAAVPVPRPGRRRAAAVTGEPPSPVTPPPGCPFHPRCPIARPRCAAERPPLAEVAAGHRAACHYPDEVAGLIPAGVLPGSPS